MQAAKLLEDDPGLVPAEFIAGDGEASAPSQDQVAELAYSYWEARGCQDGSPWEDWFRAENELVRRRER